jgi:probable F420-dependent oxidoreductase
MPDHLGDQLSPISALSAAATATRLLHVGSFVFANDYRHPLIVAREAATLDLLSGGRFELGIGAGWNTADYRKLGMSYESPAVRVDRLSEAVPIVKRLLAGETVDHIGTHYELRGAVAGLRRNELPAVPLLIGGGGPRILRLAAREANIVALQPQMDPRGRPMVRQATEGATEDKIAILRAAAGSRFEELEINVIVGDAGLVGSGRPPLESLATATKSLTTMLIETPYVLYGTLDQLRDRLLRRRDRLGISYYAIPGRAMEAMAPLVTALAGR